MLINGNKIAGDDLFEVKNPYNGDVVDTVPIAHLQDVDLAIESAVKAKKAIAEMSAFKVSNKLYEVYEKLKENKKRISKIINFGSG